MARGAFTAANYFTTASVPVSAYPISISCWFNSTDVVVDQTIFALADTAGITDYIRLVCAGTVGGDPIYMNVRTATENKTAISASGYSASTWHHALGTTDGTVKFIYLDGGNSGTNSFLQTWPAGMDVVGIGALVRSTIVQPLLGYLGEAAIWDVELTATDAASLAAGFSPLMIKPDSLVGYWPCGGLASANSIIDEVDIVGGLTATETGTVGTFAHPGGLIYPRRSQSIFLPSARATITGTATATIDEADVVAGGKTIITTLTGDTWVTA